MNELDVGDSRIGLVGNFLLELFNSAYNCEVDVE